MLNNRKYSERYCGKEAELPQEIFLLSINEIGKDDWKFQKDIVRVSSEIARKINCRAV